MTNEAEYADRMILALREKCKERQSGQTDTGTEIAVGLSQQELYREEMFGHKYSILLPVILADMDSSIIRAKYPNNNRPQIIKTDQDNDVTMTFSIMPGQETEEQTDILLYMRSLRNDMKKIWKQNVFYDLGKVMAGGHTVGWMDFKAFCIDGSIYSLMFLFQAGEQMVLGNFHCSFVQYDIWKPVILKLLTTIQVYE